jgi:hypothetical protein
MAGSEDEEILVGRSYTRARRYPLVIGRWPGSQAQLPGGPYSLPQLVVMVGGFVLLVFTREAWARFGLVPNLLLAAGVPFVAGMAVRRLQLQGRSPWSVAGSVLGLWVTPGGGRLAGRALPRVRPRQLGGVYTFTIGPRQALATAGALPAVAGGGRREAVTGVSVVPEAQVLSPAQALLAARRSGRP